jgi:hypothetical protein
VVAVRVDDDWHNLVTRIVLTSTPPSDADRLPAFPQLPHFTVLQHSYSPETLPVLLHAVKNGHLDIKGHSIGFLTGDGGKPFVKPYSYSFDRIGTDISEVLGGPYNHGHSLTLTGDQASQVFRLLPRDEEGLNAALRALPDPWGSVSDVLLHALDDPSALRGHHNRRVSFIAPLQARIDAKDCLLADGILAYTIRSGSREAGESCTLVITGTDAQGKRVARRVPLRRKRWVRDDAEFRYTGTEKLRGAKHITLTLQLASFELGQTEVESRKKTLPLLLGAYEALFPGQRNFTAALLHPVKTEARTFEEQVALLFTYCGMPNEYIGDAPKTQEAPDLLVQLSGTSAVLVVEITVGALNQQGKLARLTQRTEQVRMIVEAAGGRALPVMVTANPRRAIAQNELDAAKADGIRVLSRDDLATLFSMALRRAPVRQIAKFLAPQLVSGSVSTLWGMLERHGDTADDDFE